MRGSEQENCASNPGTKCRTARIAELNDALRRHGTNGKIVMTRGVIETVGGQLPDLLKAVAAFDAFDGDNDPHGERDYGSVEFDGHDVLWKIDYYDPRLEFGSEDPSDPAVTLRVLTMMLSSEY
jgi:hypothetical protein